MVVYLCKIKVDWEAWTFFCTTDQVFIFSNIKLEFSVDNYTMLFAGSHGDMLRQLFRWLCWYCWAKVKRHNSRRECISLSTKYCEMVDFHTAEAVKH